MDEGLADGAPWAKSCTESLEQCIKLGSAAGSEEWKRRRSLISDIKHIRIWDIDLSSRDLSNFDLSRCKLKNVKLVSSNLSGVNFFQSILRGCDLSRAILTGTSFREADLKGSIARDVSINGKTDLLFKKGRLPEDADYMLADRAEAGWARLEFDQDLSRSALHRGIVKMLGYGDSLPRLFILAAAIIIGFGLIFWAFGPSGTTSISAILYSIQYFVALGDPFGTVNFALSVLGTVEACFGLVFLAILLSVITKLLIINRS